MAAVNFYLNLVKVFGQRSKRLVWKYAIIAWGTNNEFMTSSFNFFFYRHSFAFCLARNYY